MNRFFVVLLVIFVLAACGPSAPAATGAFPESLPTPAATGTMAAPQALSIPAETEPPETPTPPASETPVVTPTFGPTPTETLLPTLELPTEEIASPAREVWDGLPTYLGDSQPGFYFRVTYNPRLWAVTQDQFGYPALGHRDIPYCVITPVGGRGMPPGVQVEHDLRTIGEVKYEVNTVLLNGVRQFVTYLAGDGVIFTGFQVNFVDQVDACLADAEAVLGTLVSVPESQATPVSQ
jgi:hypothetical protein